MPTDPRPLAPPLEPARIAELLEGSLRTIELEVEALGPELCRWHPAPGEWCANEVVGHLIEAERRGFAGRIGIILGSERPPLETWDQPAVAAARRDWERESADLLAELRALREASLAAIRRLEPADLPRFGLHPAVGELSVGDILGEWVHHDRNHAWQLFKITQARVWDQMGHARRFIDPRA